MGLAKLYVAEVPRTAVQEDVSPFEHSGYTTSVANLIGNENVELCAFLLVVGLD